MWTIEKASGRQGGSAASGIREKKGEGGRLLTSPFSLPDPAYRPAAFSIVLTDREPGTGYLSGKIKFEYGIPRYSPWTMPGFSFVCNAG